MKFITVADIMTLDIMKGCRLAAGKKGLSREVRYINVYDNPLNDTDRKIKTFAGEVFLTFFYYGRNNPDYLNDTLEFLINRQAAALIVFDEYFKEMPEDFTARCDKANLPLIFIDCKTPYSLLISDIIDYRVRAEQIKNTEDKLSAIVSHRTSEEEKLSLIADLNPNFENNVLVLFALEPDPENETGTLAAEIFNLCTAFSHDYRFFATEYHGGVLIVLSYSDSRISSIPASAEEAIELIHKYLPESAIGISNVCRLAELGTAISQSHLALQTDVIKPSQISAYRNMGIARILLPLVGTPALEEFFNDIITPIALYDENNDSQLLNTMLCFTSNDMNYKRTSAAMFVHENTIRYRIEKIKELIPYGTSEIDFYETISVASKIYRLKRR